MLAVDGHDLKLKRVIGSQTVTRCKRSMTTTLDITSNHPDGRTISTEDTQALLGSRLRSLKELNASACLGGWAGVARAAIVEKGYGVQIVHS